MTFLCLNCKKELADFYTFCDLKVSGTDKNITTYNHIEMKTSIFELRKQRISVLCENCKEETPVFNQEEMELRNIKLSRIKKEEEKSINSFKKWL